MLRNAGFAIEEIARFIRLEDEGTVLLSLRPKILQRHCITVTFNHSLSHSNRTTASKSIHWIVACGPQTCRIASS